MTSQRDQELNGWLNAPRGAQYRIDLNQATAAELEARGVRTDVAARLVESRKATPLIAASSVSKALQEAMQEASAVDDSACPLDIGFTSAWFAPRITGLEIGGDGSIRKDQSFALKIKFQNALLNPQNSLNPAELVQYGKVQLYMSEGISEHNFTVSEDEANAKEVEVVVPAEKVPSEGPAYIVVTISDGILSDRSERGAYVLANERIGLRLVQGGDGEASKTGTPFLPTVVLAERSQQAAQDFHASVGLQVINGLDQDVSFTGLEWTINDGNNSQNGQEVISFSVGPTDLSGNLDPTTSWEKNFSLEGLGYGALLAAGGELTLEIELTGLSDFEQMPVSCAASVVVRPARAYSVNLILLVPSAQQDVVERLPELEKAAWRAADILGAVGLCCQNVHTYLAIGNVDAYEHLQGSQEADELIEEVSVPGDAVDVFVVGNLVFPTNDPVGYVGAIPGPEEKDVPGDGIVIERVTDTDCNRLDWKAMGQTLAHELGHYFGLEHYDWGPSTRLMSSTSSPYAVFISDGEFDVMHQHGFVTLL